MENKTFLEKLKFGIGDGNLQYYLYNWKCPSMGAEKVCVSQPEAGLLVRELCSVGAGHPVVLVACIVVLELGHTASLMLVNCVP
jgi:hypothetical protein